MDDVFVYDVNDTMRSLGHQCPAEIITDEARREMHEITAARKFTTTFETAADMFTLGYIYGKRAERARRNGMKIGTTSLKTSDTMEA